MKWRHEDAEVIEDNGASEAVGEECDAFLAGRLVPFRWPDGTPTPVWTWLNEIAHGDVPQIVAVASRAITEETAVPERTRTVLARALLGVGPRSGVPVLQQRVLVPLELELVGQVTSPRRLIELVGRALYA
jgi:hypothetical protein